MTYIAQFSHGRDGFLQQLIRFPTPVFEAAGLPVSWWANFHRITQQMVRAPEIDFALRLGLRDHQFERLLMLLAPRQRAEEVVALAASFLGLNAIVPNSVAVPANSAEHDEIAAAFPPLRARVLQDAYRPWGGNQDVRLIDDLRLVPAIGTLFELALARGWTFAYQLNACRRGDGAEDLRWARHNLLRVEELGGLPQPMLQLQRGIVARMGQAAFYIEELVGCETNAVLGRIREAIAGAVQRLNTFPEDLIGVGERGAFDNLVVVGLHTSRVKSFQERQKVAAAASREEALSALDWHPSAGLAPSIANVARGADGEAYYLRRIEDRLATIELELAARRLQPQATECDDFKKALQHARIEPTHALGNARMILDGIVGTIYRQHCKGKDSKPLNNKIEELLDEKGKTISLFPRHIRTYLHTVRVLGNIVIHKTGDEVTSIDVEITLLALLQIVAWYLLEYRPPAS